MGGVTGKAVQNDVNDGLLGDDDDKDEEVEEDVIFSHVRPMLEDSEGERSITGEEGFRVDDVNEAPIL